MENQNLASVSEKSGSKTPLNPFLEIVYQMLENNEFEDIISWDQNGTAILVKNMDQFEKVVLKKYFSHQKITSFTRQLNMYHFKKTKRDASSYQYSNPCFVRGNSNLLKLITRRQVPRKKKQEVLRETSNPPSVLDEETQLVKKIKEDTIHFETENSTELRETLQYLQAEKLTHKSEISELRSEMQEIRAYMLDLHNQNKKLTDMLHYQNGKVQLLERQLNRINSLVRLSPAMNTFEQIGQQPENEYNNHYARVQYAPQLPFNPNREFQEMKDDLTNYF